MNLRPINILLPVLMARRDPGLVNKLTLFAQQILQVLLETLLCGIQMLDECQVHGSCFSLQEHLVHPIPYLVDDVDILIVNWDVKFDLNVMFWIVGVGPLSLGHPLPGFVPQHLGSKTGNEANDLGLLRVNAQFHLRCKHHDGHGAEAGLVWKPGSVSDQESLATGRHPHVGRHHPLVKIVTGGLVQHHGVDGLGVDVGDLSGAVPIDTKDLVLQWTATDNKKMLEVIIIMT